MRPTKGQLLQRSGYRIYHTSVRCPVLLQVLILYLIHLKLKRLPISLFYNRRKRDLYQDTFATPNKIDWNRIFGPKIARSLNSKNSRERHAKPTPNHHDLLARYKNYLNAKYNAPTYKAVQEKPLRFNIPLNQNNKNFFPSRKIKTKRKIESTHPFVEYPIKIDTQSSQDAKSVGSKTLTNLLRKSGKFADIENVKISFAPSTHHHQRFKTKSQHGARKIRSTTFKETSNGIDRNDIEGSYQFRENFGKDFVDTFGIKSRFLTPSKGEQVSYVLDAPTRIVDHLNRMKDYVGPMVQSIPNVLDTSTNYIKDFGTRFGRGTAGFFRDFIGNVKGLPRMMLSSVLAPYRRHKRNIVGEDVMFKVVGDNSGKFILENTPKLDSKSSEFSNNLDSHEIDTHSLLRDSKQAKKDFESNIPYRFVQNEIDNIMQRIKQLNDEGFNVEEEIFKDVSKLQFQKDSFVAILNDMLLKGIQNDPDMKITSEKMVQRILTSKYDLTMRIGEILASRESFIVGNALVKELVILEKLHWVLTKLLKDFSEDTNEIVEDMEYLHQLNMVQEESILGIRNMLKHNNDFQIKKEITILDQLKAILRSQNRKEWTSKVNQIAEIFWEINYCKKLLKNTILEMNHNMKSDFRISREIKIISDLEKQIEKCQNKLFGFF